ncbi:hypothetical protein AAC387_Pa12g0503 [Persea americana]
MQTFLSAFAERLQIPMDAGLRSSPAAAQSLSLFTTAAVYSNPWQSVVLVPGGLGPRSELGRFLRQYDIKYQPRTAIKAQVLEDFIVEFTSPSSAPTLFDTELRSNKDMGTVTETEQEQSWKKFLDSAWKVFVEGSSTSKRAGAGIVLQSLEGLVIEQALTLGFKASNNEAEYEALIAGLNNAKILEARRIVVFSDSQLVTSQLSGDYQACDDRMVAYLAHAKGLLSEFERAEVQQIGRESNSHADALTSLASAVEAQNKRIVEVETLQGPSIELQRPQQLMCVDLGLSWMDPIIAYLKDDQLPEDKTEAHKIRLKATRFWVSPDGRLYRNSYIGPYLQCVYPTKATGGPTCRRTPSSRRCEKCQKFPHSLHQLAQDLSPLSSPWPFAQWGLDIVGPLHRTPGNKRWLIVATDYFTKWIKAEPLSSITEQDIKNFEHSIRNVYSTPAYLQSNDEAEISNKVILDGLKKRLDQAKGRWAEELPSVLWAYRTTPRRSTSATMFSLAYGMEEVIPLEVGLPTLRTKLCDQGLNDLNVARELDFAEERRKAAAIRLAAYQQQLARGYNQKVKEKRFAVGELVLKKTLPGDRNPNEGKLAPNWQGPFEVFSAVG